MLDECDTMNAISLFANIRQGMRNNFSQIIDFVQVNVRVQISYTADCFLNCLPSYNLSSASFVVCNCHLILKLKEYIAGKEDKILEYI